MNPIKLSEEEAQRLIAFYATAEAEILQEINRGLLKGNNVTYLKGMRENVKVIIDGLVTGSRSWCEQAIPRVYVEGTKNVDGMVKRTAGFGAIHQQAAQVLAENTFNRLEDIGAFVGRRTNDIYRELALESVRGSTVGYKTWEQTARRYRNELADRGITGFVDRAGNEWRLKTYAEMVARTSTMEAHLEGTKNRLLEHGYDLVEISSHPGACPKCESWQGKVLSLTGKTEGYPTLDEAKAAGLFHPNCRHAYGLHVDLEAEIEKAKEPAKPKNPKPHESDLLKQLRRAKNRETVINLDGDMIEGQVGTLEKIEVNGKPGVRFTCKVTEKYLSDVYDNVKAMGATLKNDYNWVEAEVREATKAYGSRARHSFSTRFLSYAKKGIEVNYLGRNNAGALQGFMEITVMGKRTGAKLENAIKKVLTEKALKTPTLEEKKLLKLNRLLWQHAPAEQYHNRHFSLGVDGLEKMLSSKGIDPARAEKMKLKEVFPGYSTYVEPGMAKKYKKAGAEYIWAGVGYDANIVATIIESPGLMSSRTRLQRGMFGSGASVNSDIRSGGADSAFVRLATKKQIDKHDYENHFCGGHYQVHYSLDVLERTDWYAFNYDNFGNINDGWSNRASALEFISQVDNNYNVGNEIMLRQGIANKHLTKITCKNNYKRDELLQVLRDRGITEVNNIKIEDFVEVRAKI